VSRVALVRAETFAPLGNASQLAIDANSALMESGIPWTAHAEGNRVWIEKDADHAGR
jgi:hypothetical protein